MTGKVLTIEGRRLHVVTGKTLDEWNREHDDGENWDFPAEEIIDGTVEFEEDRWYWLIGGRFYETHDEAA